jgi:DNA polymerase-3 subunit beta
MSPHIDCIFARDELARAMRTVSHALGRSRIMPILGAIRLDCTDSAATLTATNLEYAIQSVVFSQEKYGGSGAFVVSGEMLRKIVDALDGQTVRMTTEPQSSRVLIASGTTQVKILQFQLEDFPSVPTKPTQPLCSIDRSILARSLELVSFAAMPENKATNFVLTGIFVKIQNNELTLAASDGYRLAVRTAPCLALTQDTQTFIIPASFAEKIGQILHAIPETQVVEISAAEQWLFLSAAHTVCMARIMDEKYPDYAKNIPEQYTCVVEVERQTFLEALERASITASDVSEAVVFSINDGIHMHSQDESKGQAREHIPALRSTGQPMEIAFRASHLLDAFKRMRSSSVTLKVAAPDCPAALQPGNADDDRGFLYICMPVSIVGPET